MVRRIDRWGGDGDLELEDDWLAQPSNIFLNAEHESAVRTGVKTYARLKTDIRRTLRSLRDHGLALAAIKVLEAGVDLNTSLKSQAGLIESDSSAASHDPGEQPGLRQKLIRALAADAALFNEVGGRLLTADEDELLVNAIAETLIWLLARDLPSSQAGGSCQRIMVHN